MKKSILIAEDEEKVRQLIKRTLELENKDYELHEAEDGDTALAKAAEVNPDLLLLDVMMPGMSGYDVCKEIKKNPSTKNIIVIFVTARGETDLAQSTMKNVGGDGFLAKPFTSDELTGKVKDALGH